MLLPGPAVRVLGLSAAGGELPADPGDQWMVLGPCPGGGRGRPGRGRVRRSAGSACGVGVRARVRGLLASSPATGRRPSNQDQLLTGAQLALDETGHVLVVRVENQGCSEWGIRISDLDQDDPPVVMRITEDPQGWIPYAERWSLACLEMIVFEVIFSDSDLAWDTELDDDAVAIVEARYERLPMPDLARWSLPQVRWFAGPDLLLRDEARPGCGRCPALPMRCMPSAKHCGDRRHPVAAGHS
jgi:hypothetical protein